MIVTAPLVVLTVDIWRSPILFETHRVKNYASITSLLAHQSLFLGTIAGHRIHVSIDDILSPKFLGQVQGRGNALVISLFIDEKGRIFGALTRAILEKLRRVSPNDHIRMVQRLAGGAGIRPRRLLPFDLDVPKERYREFPVDHLYALTLTKADPERDYLPEAFRRIIRLADKDAVSNLIIPCVGTNWERSGSLEFDEIFRPFFEGLEGADHPRDVYISLYAEWPSFQLEEAVTSLNSTWDAYFQKPGQWAFYHRDFRLFLFFLSVCLLVSSFYAPLTIKNFLIISGAFLGTTRGSGTVLAFLTQGYSLKFVFAVQILTLTALSVGFPFIVKWNPKDLFGKTGE